MFEIYLKTEQKPALLELIGVETVKDDIRKVTLVLFSIQLKKKKFEMSVCKVTNRLFLI